MHYTVLHEENKASYKKMGELQVYKTNFEENKRKWANKVEASAGDVAFQLRDYKVKMTEFECKVEELQELVGKLERENQVFRGQLNIVDNGVSIE